MADAHDAGGRAGGASEQRVRVNGRRVAFDLTTGEITKGPPAVAGKFLCAEQMADLLEAGEYGGRLFVVDRPEDVRLAEAEYRFLRPKVRDMHTPVIPGVTVDYGNHGRFRVVGMDDSKRDVVLEAGDGKHIMVPLPRFQNETEIVEAEPSAPAADPYTARAGGPLAGDGHIEINDEDINRIVRERVDALLESDEVMEALVSRLANRLATTLDDHGQESPGDAIAHSGDDSESDNGDTEA